MWYQDLGKEELAASKEAATLAQAEVVLSLSILLSSVSAQARRLAALLFNKLWCFPTKC